VPYLTPETEVHVYGKRGVLLATGFVVEHTDDSDQYVGNVEQWMTIRVLASHTSRIPGTVLKMRRENYHRGEHGWAPAQRAPKGADGRRKHLPSNMRVVAVRFVVRPVYGEGMNPQVAGYVVRDTTDAVDLPTFYVTDGPARADARALNEQLLRRPPPTP
jgi:hypothetical protein